jgi:hypothetical protein
MTRKEKELKRRIQERLVLRLSLIYQTKIRRLIKQSFKTASTAYESSGLVEPAVQKINESLEKELYTLYVRSFSSMGEITRKDLKERKGYVSFEKKDTAFAESMIKFARINAAQKVTQISKATTEKINSIIVSGIKDELMNTEIAKNILTVGDIESKYRAVMIARTEIHSAANAGSLEVAKESGIVAMKEWISVNDERTRAGDNSDYDHTDVDPVPLNEDFYVSGEYLKYPGDPMGSAGNIINCRCAVVYD